jgi:hypothetical protein
MDLFQPLDGAWPTAELDARLPDLIRPRPLATVVVFLAEAFRLFLSVARDRSTPMTCGLRL